MRMEIHGSWDHPRTCGEKRNWAQGPAAGQGSPPHMRGKGNAHEARLFGLGITPAHAGKRQGRAGTGGHYRDHPRTCGEKQALGGAISGGVGSPPHMRGKAACTGRGVPGHRITPAHAGKSCQLQALRRLLRDHPRTCGEKRHRAIHHARGVGSPPHMRGKG